MSEDGVLQRMEELSGAGCRPCCGRELTEMHMANEGSTKPTYSELEAELLRVRGLLQRQSDADILADILAQHDDFESACVNREWWHKCYCGDTFSTRDILDPLLDNDFRKHVATALANFPQSSSLVSQGAESADIGKLDTADKSGKVNRVDEKHVCGQMGFNPSMGDTCPGCAKRLLGSAETGGEKA